MKRTVLVTGALGNIGAKFAAHNAATGAYDLRLLDQRPGDGVIVADLGVWDETWAARFAGVDTVLHLAGDPRGVASWAEVMHANVHGTQNVLRAARAAGVRRVVFASTNQVMLGYRFREGPVTTDMPPAPLSPYGISKLFCEEIGRAFAAETGISFIALRIGYFQRGDNLPGAHMEIGAWGQSMWLSNADMMRALTAAIEAENVPFAVVNLESANEGMRWDMEHTRQTIGFVPQDHAVPVMGPANLAMDEKASAVRVAPGTWLNEHFHQVKG